MPSYDGYSVALAWTSANESGVEYKIYRDGVHVRPMSPASSPWASISGLRPLTDYTFKVEACFAGGGNCTTDGPTLEYRTAADTSRLDLQTANVLDTAMTLHFSDPLDDASVPAVSDFTVTVNGAAVAVTDVDVHADAEELGADSR